MFLFVNTLKNCGVPFKGNINYINITLLLSNSIGPLKSTKKKVFPTQMMSLFLLLQQLQKFQKEKKKTHHLHPVTFGFSVTKKRLTVIVTVLNKSWPNIAGFFELSLAP